MTEGMISREEFRGAIDSMRSLLIQLDSARSQASELRHKTIGDTLQRIMNDQAAMRGDLRAHAEEDDRVENRVTILEEGAKRVTWVTLVGIPSAIAGWEGIKRFWR